MAPEGSGAEEDPISTLLRAPTNEISPNGLVPLPPTLPLLVAVEEAASERDALLGPASKRRRTSRSRSTSVRRKLPWYKQPKPIWVLPATFLLAMFAAAGAGPELEILTSTACRVVEPNPITSPISMPVPPLGEANEGARQPYHTFLGFRLAQGVDKEWASHCRQNASVQKRVTSYATMVSMIAGVVAALTSGPWGAFSDLKGRNLILAIGFFGGLVSNFAFVLVGTYPERYGFTVILLGSIGEALLGGEILTMSVATAYLADVTDDGSRAAIFSLNEGFKSAGYAFGPAIGSLLMRSTGLILSPYYASIVIRILYILLLLVIPESLSPGRRRAERVRLEGVAKERAAHYETLKAEHHSAGSLRLFFARAKSQLVDFFSPLAVLLPRPVEEKTTSPLSLKRGRRDWNLTNVSASFAFFYAVAAITAVKIIWARSQFDWDAEATGWYITYIATVRLLFLLVALPWALKMFKVEVPLPASSRPAVGAEAQEVWDNEALMLKKRSDAAFDLKLARVSIVIAIAGYLIMVPPSPYPVFFLIGSGVVSCASGALPALQSLALSLAPSNQAGKVLSSLSVLGSIAVMIVAPPLFGAVFALTVNWFSPMIFLTAVGWYVLALVPTFIIRLKA